MSAQPRARMQADCLQSANIRRLDGQRIDLSPTDVSGIDEKKARFSRRSGPGQTSMSSGNWSECNVLIKERAPR
jgi:hypothetical protein